MMHKYHSCCKGKRFSLGLFAFNCSGGAAITKVKERRVNSWENKLKVTQFADEAGFEYPLPLAGGTDYDGETDFHSNTWNYSMGFSFTGFHRADKEVSPRFG